MAPLQRPLFEDILLRRRRRAAARLRREVMGGDGSLAHPYFRALDRSLRDYEAAVDLDALVRACAAARVVYVGDFHAVSACQLFAGDLVEALAGRVDALAIGVEFVYTRQQAWLDRRQAGLLDDAGLRRRIRYDDEWGYPWEGYGALLDRARRLGVPVHALDIAPRGGFDGLRRRDAHAARRIHEILERDSATTLVVLFGESHVAPSHLPRHVARRAARGGGEYRAVMIAQNPDRLHWRVLEREGRRAAAVRVDRSTYAVFNTGPFEKYESYRQLLERWRNGAGDDDLDLTSAIHHLLGMLVRWLGIRPGRRRVQHRAGWTERLEDAYPEVFSGAEAGALLPPVLAEHGRSPAEITEARARLRRGGTVFDPRSNSMFVTRYAPAAAAGECARFLRAALAGRLYATGDEWRGDELAAMYGAAYLAALVEVGSRLVDPEGAGRGAPSAHERAAAAAGSPAPPAVDPALRRALDEVRRLAETTGGRLPGPLAGRLARDRSLRRALAARLGRVAGESLFEGVRAGRVDTAALRRVFTRQLTPRTAPAALLDLLRPV